jgi:hypothetical protein
MLAERAHLLSLLLWGAGSALAGTVILLVVSMRRRKSEVLDHFAFYTAGWGVAVVAIALVWWRTLEPRDIDGFNRLNYLLWFSAGAETAVAAAGAVLLVIGWRLARPALLGSGSAIMAQGLGLLLLGAMTMARLAQLASATVGASR